MRTWRHCCFGAFYGAWAGITVGILVTLYTTLDTFINWPPDGTASWFLGGLFSIGIFSAIAGCVIGAIGGLAFGFIGSFSTHPFVWIVGGVVGGIVSSLCFAHIVWSMTHKPNDVLSLFWGLMPYGLLPSIVLAVIGWSVSSAMRTGRPKMPRLQDLQPPLPVEK